MPVFTWIRWATPTRNLSVLALCWLCCSSVHRHHMQTLALPGEESSNNDFVVAGYLPDYRFYVSLPDMAPLLTDLMLFSVQPQADGSLGSCCLDDSHYKQAQDAIAASNATKKKKNLWVTIGGGGRSHEFLQAMKTHPAELVQSLYQLAQQYQLDGLDMDCEAFSNKQDYHAYLSWIIQYAVPNFQKVGLKLSVALHVGMLLPTELYSQLDRIHLMTYDMMGETSSSHASLEKVQHAVEKLIGHGCPAQRIVLGIPAYARQIHNPGSVQTFAELVDKAYGSEDILRNKLNGGDLSHDRLMSQGQYGGDSPETVARKVKYAKQQGLRGVFFWELGQDKQVQDVAPGGYLLEAAAQAVERIGDSTSPTNKDEL